MKILAKFETQEHIYEIDLERLLPYLTITRDEFEKAVQKVISQS